MNHVVRAVMLVALTVVCCSSPSHSAPARVAVPTGALYAVDALSSRDVWAVGSGDHGGLIEHWDGIRWRIVYEPEPTILCCSGLAAISSNDVWITGSLVLPATTAALHWDGRQWHTVAMPAVKDGFVMRLVAVASHDVWAVGGVYAAATTAPTPTPAMPFQRPLTETQIMRMNDPSIWRALPPIQKPLVEHWDGRRWRVVPGPPVQGALLDVAVVSAHDVWAVGFVGSMPWNPTAGLIAHWDGGRWRAVAEPGPDTGCCSGIAAIARDDLWAAGGWFDNTSRLVLHWDGVRWRSGTLPLVRDGGVNQLAAVSAYDVWAVGARGSQNLNLTLIERWDGVRWRVVPSPNVVGSTNELFDVAAVTARDVWAVGSSMQNGCGGGPCPTQPLIEHWDGVHWSIVPS